MLGDDEGFDVPFEAVFKDCCAYPLRGCVAVDVGVEMQINANVAHGTTLAGEAYKFFYSRIPTPSRMKNAKSSVLMRGLLSKRSAASTSP